MSKCLSKWALRGFVRVAALANRGATVYTNAPNQRREVVLADLCTLLHTHGCPQRCNSVHKCPKTTPRGRFRQFVYTPASPRLSTTVQQCTQMPQNGAERPFPPICVHSCMPTVVRNVATVYTSAPKRPREAIFTDLCTLLHHRPGGEARPTGEAHPTGAVRQPPTHTNSRSLQLGTCPHVSVYRLWGRWIRQTGCDRARRSCRLRRVAPRACLARRWFLAPSRG